MDKSMEDFERDHLFLQVLVRLSVIEEVLVNKGILSFEELEKFTENKTLELTTKIENLLKLREEGQKGA